MADIFSPTAGMDMEGMGGMGGMPGMGGMGGMPGMEGMGGMGGAGGMDFVSATFLPTVFMAAPWASASVQGIA